MRLITATWGTRIASTLTEVSTAAVEMVISSTVSIKHVWVSKLINNGTTLSSLVPRPSKLLTLLSEGLVYIGWLGSRKRINYHGNSLKRPQSHGSLFEKSTAAGFLGEWLSASASRG